MINRLRVLVAMLPFVLLMSIAVTHYHEGSKTQEDHPPSTSVPTDDLRATSVGRAALFDDKRHLPTTTTTTTAPPPPTTTTTAPPPPPNTVPPPPPSASGGCASNPDAGGCWDRLAQCESGGNWAINTGNGYYGGLQFALSSWRGVGGTGYPHEHSRETQIEMGRRLWQQGGWQHWPGCSRSFGWL